MKTCEISPLSELKVTIRSDYDQDFIEALKRLVPHTERSWNEEEADAWVVNCTWLEDVKDLALRHYDEPEFVDVNPDTGAVEYENLRTGEKRRQESLFT